MIPGHLRTLLEKAAVDNGFDLVRDEQGSWLPAESSHAPLRVWLTVDGEGRPTAALSRADVAAALSELGTPGAIPVPLGASAARRVPDIGRLHRLLRRAYQLARTLPHELLHTFNEKTANLPRSTEVERLVVQRVGQEIFRAGLIEYWEGRCPITGLAVAELLRASHIKPWADCGSDAERLDVLNGLLLAPQLDAAFDRGFVTFQDDGAMVVSAALLQSDRAALGLSGAVPRLALTGGHRTYLAWHRSRQFKG